MGQAPDITNTFLSLLPCRSRFHCYINQYWLILFLSASKQVNSVAVSMDGSLLLSGSDDQTAHVWHIYSRQCLRVLNHRGNMNLLIGLQSFLALRTPHYYRHVNNTYSSCTPRQKSYYTSLTKSISQCYWLSRGGGYSTKFLTGGSAPRSNLLYFYTHFCQRRYSFHIYLLLTNGIPWTYLV